MQIRCFCDLYVSEKLEKKKNQVLMSLMERRLEKPVYLITLAQGEQNHLDVYSSLFLQQGVYDNETIFIVGLAEDYTAAIDLVEHITQDVVEETGEAEIRSYIIERQRVFEESRG